MNSLEQLFSVNGTLLDKNNDGIAEGLKGKLYFPEHNNYELTAFVIELSARLAYECVAIDYPLAISYNKKLPTSIATGSIIVKLDNTLPNNTSKIEINNNTVIISGYTEESFKALRLYLCSLFPNVSEDYSYTCLIKDIEKSADTQVFIKSIEIDPDSISPINVVLNSYLNEVKEIEIKVPSLINTVKINGVDLNLQHLKATEENKEIYCLCEQNPMHLDNAFNYYSITSKSKAINKDEVMPDILISENISVAETKALAHMAARFALEFTQLSFPIAKKIVNKDICRPSLKVKIQDKYSSPKVAIYDKDIVVKANNINIEEGIENFFKHYPNLSEGRIYSDLTNYLSDALKGTSPLGEILRIVQHSRNNQEDTTAYINIGPLDENLAKFKKSLAKENVKLCSMREPREVMSWKIDLKWEVTRATELIEEKLLTKLNENDEVELFVLVSEEKSIRDRLQKSLIKKLSDLNVNVKSCIVNRAYKQGMCWIMEQIVPTIVSNNLHLDIDKIRIGFRPFLPPNQTEWQDEAGATPTLAPKRDDSPDKYFDLPTRLLQELYPIDDLLSLELGIDRDKIEFFALENNEHDYKVEIYNSSNDLILEDTTDVKFSERPYLDAWENIGKVHPNTGWVMARVNGELVVDERVETDLEKIWDIYQSNILHDVRQYVEIECHNEITADKQPFFRELNIEISASDIDIKLPTRTDLMSTLDALHEDIYFVGLDFFRTLGLRSSGQKIGEPGLILPRIKKTLGEGPKLKATLYVEKQKQACLFSGNLHQELQTTNNIDLILQSIEYTNDGINLEYDLDGNLAELEDVLDNWLYLAQSGDPLIPAALANTLNYVRINYRNDDFMNKQWSFCLANFNVSKHKSVSIENVDVPWGEVIGVEENNRILEDLSKVKGLSVYELNKSYQGRKIHAIEVKPDFNADVISHRKLINTKPSFVLNHRHHANEISATNSAYDMLKKLLTTELGKEYRSKMNIALIPFENADGAAIHYELMQDNPEWKLHVSRYNSVGMEIANGYFDENSPYGECHALPSLYCRWIPDAFVDNHGVPSHEWDQQFAGYVAPWFRGFWLPRALFYGYFWYASDEQYQSHRTMTEQVAKEVASDMNKDKEITEMNIDWQNRFVKYANSYLPNLFPADYRDNLIYYWIPFKSDKKSRHFASRFPEYTVLDWTTEVSDETAHGEYLEHCSRALTISDFATMRVLATVKTEFETKIEIENEVVCRSHKRKRPIVI